MMCGSIIVIVVIAIVIISNIGRCNHHHELNFKIPQFSSPTAKSLIKDASGNHWHGGACNARQVERWIGMQWWCALVPASELASPPILTVIQQSETKGGQCMEGRPPFQVSTHSPSPSRFQLHSKYWSQASLSSMINRLLGCFHLKEFQFNR